MTIQTQTVQSTQAEFLEIVGELTHLIKEKRGDSPEILDKHKSFLLNLIKTGNEHFKTQPEKSKKKWALLAKEARAVLSPSFFNRRNLQALTLVTMVSASALIAPEETVKALEAILPGAVEIPGVPFFQLWWVSLQTTTMLTTYLLDETIAQLDRFVGAKVGAPLLLGAPLAIYAVQAASRLCKKYFKNKT